MQSRKGSRRTGYTRLGSRPIRVAVGSAGRSRPAAPKPPGWIHVSGEIWISRSAPPKVQGAPSRTPNGPILQAFRYTPSNYSIRLAKTPENNFEPAPCSGAFRSTAERFRSTREHGEVPDLLTVLRSARPADPVSAPKSRDERSSVERLRSPDQHASSGAEPRRSRRTKRFLGILARKPRWPQRHLTCEPTGDPVGSP